MYAKASFVISALFISSLIAFNFSAASESTTGVITKVVPFGVVGVVVGVVELPSLLLATSASTFMCSIFLLFKASLKLSTTVPANSFAFAFIPSIPSVNPLLNASPIPENPFLIWSISKVKIPIIKSPTPPKIPNAAFPNALKTVIMLLKTNFPTANKFLN